MFNEDRYRDEELGRYLASTEEDYASDDDGYNEDALKCEGEW